MKRIKIVQQKPTNPFHIKNNKNLFKKLSSSFSFLFSLSRSLFFLLVFLLFYKLKYFHHFFHIASSTACIQNGVESEESGGKERMRIDLLKKEILREMNTFCESELVSWCVGGEFFFVFLLLVQLWN